MTDEPKQYAHDGLYRERAHLLALLTGVLGPEVSHIGDTDPEAEGWPVLTLELPTGQASWHIAPEDLELFQHVRPTTEADRPWDGHSTEEKYQRTDRLARAMNRGHRAVRRALDEPED